MISLNEFTQLPTGPGVYLMKDTDETILYIGKAINIQSRVRSHFSGGHARPDLYDKVAGVEFIVTENEVEALLLENSLIKDKQPRYNARLKDDKRYPYLKLSLDEKFPRLHLTRTLPKKKKNPPARKGDRPAYFGPFPHVRDARRVLQTLQEVLPLRSCSIPSSNLKLDRPCLEFEMHRCLAPCVESECSATEYREVARKVEGFLKGDHKEVADDLKQRMEAASSELAFEKASIYRDALQSMELFRTRQSVSMIEEDSEDYLAGYHLGDVTCVVCLRRRRGSVKGSEYYFLECDTHAPLSEVLSAFIGQHYGSAPEIPRRLLCSHLPSGLEILETWLTGLLSKRVTIAQPHRGPRVRLIGLALKNAEFHAAEQYRKRHGGKQRIHESVLRLGSDLGLSRLPLRIEGFDISHHRGEEPVASMVVFENGKPKKSNYRKFNISSATGGDDFRSMEEVISRRFLHTDTKFGAWPDLVLIDGGPVQLEFALKAIQSVYPQLDETHRPRLDNLQFLSLAKREEEIFLPGKDKAIMLDSRNEGLKLLQRVRDESHRFAIGFHRSRKGKGRGTSALESIPGIGPARLEKLLIRFGSMESLAKASPREIAAVPGISLTLAEEIIEACKSQ